MPPANQNGFFHTEEPLNVVHIADIQELRKGETDLELLNEFEYKGVLFIEVATKHGADDSTKDDSMRASKRRRIELRAIVLGQSQNEPGKMALFMRPLTTFQVLVGIETKQKGGISVGQIRWCSGLQLKWIPHTTPSTRVETGLFAEKKVQHGRVALAKELHNLIADEEDWSEIPWDTIKGKINAVQRQLSAKSSPKQRQQLSGSGRRQPKSESPSPDATEDTKMDTQKAAASFEVEDWSNTRVKRCGFDIHESKNLDDDEKQQVIKLMKKFVVGEKADAYVHSRLADLLDRAFEALFDMKILEDFKKAASANDDIYSLPSFVPFVDWWERRDIEADTPPRTSTRSLSPKPYEYYLADTELNAPPGQLLLYMYQRILRNWVRRTR